MKNVHRQLNVQNVNQHIIQMDPVVHFALHKDVQIHAMYRQELVQLVIVDISLMERNVQHVHRRWQIVKRVHLVQPALSVRVRVIIWQVQTHVQHAPRKQIVRRVTQNRISVQHVRLIISQVEVDVLLVRRRIAQLVVKVMANALHV